MIDQPRLPTGKPTVFERILIAIDGSEPSDRAASLGAQLAVQLGAWVALVHVVDPALATLPDSGVLPPDLLDELRQEGRELLRRTAAQMPPGIRFETFLRVGGPADELLDAARDWRAELVVMGTHGRTGVARLVIGSTAEAVVERAPCPVLTVRSGNP